MMFFYREVLDHSSKKLGDDDKVRRAAANYINKKSHQFSVGKLVQKEFLRWQVEKNGSK